MPQLSRIVCRRTGIIVSLVLMLGLAALASTMSARAQSADSQASALIATGATVHIYVPNQPDVTGDYQVDANGDITIPNSGKVHVLGLKADQASVGVNAALGKIYDAPDAMVTTSGNGMNTITVIGSVQRKGFHSARRDAHLNDIIQTAAPTPDADLSKVKVTRGPHGQQRTTLTFDLVAFSSNGDISNNPPLADGDVVSVPSTAAETYSVSVVGEVANAGRYDVLPGTTVYDLIKLAGGLDEGADGAAIYVQPLGSLDRHAVDYDHARQAPADPTINPVLKDGDKVVVPESATVPVFSITGAVVKPGQYPLRGRVSLADAEGLAEGVQDHAKLDKVTVTRESANGAEVVKINAKDPTVAANFVLQPGDNVFIPQGRVPSRIDPLEAIGVLIGVISIFR